MQLELKSKRLQDASQKALILAKLWMWQEAQQLQTLVDYADWMVS